ncbi:MAG: hypothetical protein RL095_2937 [Verrucomicrobiota bacterium]|jgi:hypothetical protein
MNPQETSEPAREQALAAFDQLVPRLQLRLRLMILSSGLGIIGLSLLTLNLRPATIPKPAHFAEVFFLQLIICAITGMMALLLPKLILAGARSPAASARRMSLGCMLRIAILGSSALLGLGFYFKGYHKIHLLPLGIFLIVLLLTFPSVASLRRSFIREALQDTDLAEQEKV